jgi:hypothetical protein
MASSKRAAKAVTAPDMIEFGPAATDSTASGSGAGCISSKPRVRFIVRLCFTVAKVGGKDKRPYYTKAAYILVSTTIPASF